MASNVAQGSTRLILIGAAVLLSIGMGLRQSIGLFLTPVPRRPEPRCTVLGDLYPSLQLRAASLFLLETAPLECAIVSPYPSSAAAPLPNLEDRR